MPSIPTSIFVTCLLIVLPGSEIASAQQPSQGGHHAYPNRRMVWSPWYHDKLVPVRQDREAGRQALPEASTRSWNREDLTERPTSTQSPRSMQNRAPRHHVERHRPEYGTGTGRSEKFSAVAVAEYGGTRAIAYAGYHNNRRHHLREAITPSYQRVSPTTPTYTRHHPGRRVCSRQAPNSISHHHRGRQIRLVYTELSSSFLCCPGWAQVTQLSFGCNKPSCPAPCLNGGICSSPGRCTCPKGFTGNQCQTDVDECVTEKPCGQLCGNLPGTYECHCRPGFQLQKDGQSCRKNDSDGTAFEARDLENDFHEVSTTTTKRPSTASHDTENEVGDADLDQDFEIILKRLTKLEKQVAKGRKRDTEATEINTRIELAVDSVNEMKRAVENVQLMQQELYDMRSKMKEYESEARKMQHLTNRVAELEGRLRLRCRSTIPINGGSLNM